MNKENDAGIFNKILIENGFSTQFPKNDIVFLFYRRTTPLVLLRRGVIRVAKTTLL